MHWYILDEQVKSILFYRSIQNAQKETAKDNSQSPSP